MMAYTVTASLPTKELRERYVAWLRDGHVAQVLAGGASCAEVVALDGDAAPYRVQSRYWFSDHAALARYVAEVAPALRAEGLALFANAGVTFARDQGVIVQQWEGSGR